MLVEIALNATGRDGATPVLTYSVPARLRERIGVGQLVWAPLRRRRVQGVVLRFAPHNGSTAGLRDLDDLGDPAAQITPAGLRLAEWVATTYRAPLYEALALLLPPGAGQESITTWRATATGVSAELGALPERERAVLYYLRTHGEQGEDGLRKVLRGADAELRATYAALYERGLISNGAALSTRKTRPRRVPVARLTLAPDELATALDELARAPRQQAALRWIVEQGAEYAIDNGETPSRRDGAPPPAGATPPPPLPLRAITAATGATSQALRELERRGLITIDQIEVRRDPLAATILPPDAPPPLTPAQRSAYEQIVAALDKVTERQGDKVNESPRVLEMVTPSPRHPVTLSSTFLLHGITGSGKTEIYLRTIGRAMRLGMQALVLVPEIALTAQLVRRFAARFPGQVAVLHSGLSLGERYDEWRRLRRGEARVAIGSRSALFAPLPDLGLIVVDEEHELTYKADRSPRYHARAAAEALANITGSVLVLGSATPSVESYHAVQTGRYRLLELHERVGGAIGADGMPRIAPLPLPPVRLVDMRRELQSGNRSIFSRSLQQALDETLERGDQAILFLNRRGAAGFVMCRDCGQVMNCPTCSGPMTVHYAAGDGGQASDNGKNGASQSESVMVCHSCGFRALIPHMCPNCLSTRIRSFGIGTQRVAEAVNELLPQARVLRWDRDSVGAKGAHNRLLDAFLEGKADVLVGTQMIAKGLDLPRVALVGVVAADTGLHLPDFRSGERAFQLLTQVAGRAGRRTAGAQVIIQSYNPEHYALQAAQEHDYAAFYTQEIAFRRATAYPPFGRLVRFIYAAGSENAARREAGQLAERLHTQIARRGDGWGLIGPAPAFMQRMRGRWRWHIILRMPADIAPRTLNALLDDLGPLFGWSVDVDPVHVL